MMLDAIRTLIVVAEEGSLNKAADRLRLTQPAVTRKLQRLEQALDACLLDRRVKPLKLTPAGMTVLARGRGILQSLSELKDCVSRDAEPNGAIRIGIAHGLSEPSLADLVAPFRARYPRLNPCITSDLSPKILASLRAGSLDAALVLADVASRPLADLESKVVGREDVLAFRGRRMASTRPRTLEEAGALPWVVNPEGCQFRRFMNRTIESAGGTMSIAAEVHDLGLQVALVVSGLGLGFLPERFIAEHPLRSQLQALDIKELRTNAEIVLARGHQLGPLGAVVDGFEEVVLGWLSKSDGARPRAVRKERGLAKTPAVRDVTAP